MLVAVLLLIVTMLVVGMGIRIAASIAKRTCLETSYCSVGASDREESSSALVVAEEIAAGVVLVLAVGVPIISSSDVVDDDIIDDGADVSPDELVVVSLNGSRNTPFSTSPFPKRDLCLSTNILGGIGIGRRLHCTSSVSGI